MGSILSNNVEEAMLLESRLLQMVHRTGARDQAILFAHHATAAFVELFHRHAVGAGLRHAAIALDAADLMGNPTAMVRARGTCGAVAMMAGRTDEAHRVLLEAVAMGERHQVSYALNIARMWAAAEALDSRRPDEARQHARLLSECDNPVLRAMGFALIATLDLDGGRIEEATRGAREVERSGPIVRPWGQALSALASVARGDVDAALAPSSDAWTMRHVPMPWYVVPVLEEARASTLLAAGGLEEARVVAREARARIERMAATLEDAADREACTRTSWHRRILAVAARLGV
jgi:hypothetical protein